MMHKNSMVIEMTKSVMHHVKFSFSIFCFSHANDSPKQVDHFRIYVCLECVTQVYKTTLELEVLS